MKLRLLILLGLIALSINNSFADESTHLLNSLQTVQIAVEKNTGRGGGYENNFSGWVGSLRVDLDNRFIFISEFTEFDGQIQIFNGVYKITRLDNIGQNINFQCTDQNPMTNGLRWTGKIWFGHDNDIKLEMVMEQSPRRWVNLGDNGKKFLKDNYINLNLGI